MTEKDVTLRSAFWGGRMTYRKWRGILRKGPQGHMAVFVQAFRHLPMDWLLNEIGAGKFISLWPEMRNEFSADSGFDRTIVDAWDAVWGAMATGDAQYPVSKEVACLTNKRREILKEITCNPGISIYNLAERIQRDYSRVLKDIRHLADIGEIEIKLDPYSKRGAKKLLPIHSVNLRLKNL